MEPQKGLTWIHKGGINKNVPLGLLQGISQDLKHPQIKSEVSISHLLISTTVEQFTWPRNKRVPLISCVKTTTQCF